MVPDGTVRDEFRLARGWWEAKDTSDKLASEIQKKLKAGYPTRNTIFEDTQTAVLYQDRSEAGEFTLGEPVKIAELLNRFFSHDETDEREFHRAMDEFKNRIPDLAQSLREHIAAAHKTNKKFKVAFAEFVTLCRASLNPELSEVHVDEMLIQHLLTERLMRNLFQNPEFTDRNVIASQVENVIAALASASFSKSQFLAKLDPYYKAIEKAGSNLSHFTEKQDFLNSVYEQFFQKFSPDIADTHGIVYTPREIVDYMCNSVEEALKEEFGYTLASPEVVILDPCTGTGNFIVNLIERMPGKALADAYHNRFFANEVMLLPYYVASLNIEHAYYERMKQYEAFEGLCFVDTLDMADAQQIGLFTLANTERVEREKKAAITVIIGNPPYNVGQRSENEGNPNRKYTVVDGRIRETYAKDSKATNKNSLSDMYVKFFRWATDRLGSRDGIVCFVSNNGFLNGIAFDGFREHLSRDFQRIDHFDLLGNARTTGERRRQEGGNVFDDQIRTGIGITVAVRRKGAASRIRYHVVPPYEQGAKKRGILAQLGRSSNVSWQTLTPDAQHTWLVLEHAKEYREFLPVEAMFSLHTVGVKTNRDDVVYDWDRDTLAERMKTFIASYNTEVHRHKANPAADWPDLVKWSRDLKQDARRGRLAVFDPEKIRRSLYRTFTKQWLYFDRIMNEEVYKCFEAFAKTTLAICCCIDSQMPFSAQMTDTIPSHAPGGRPGQCFPLSHLKDSAVAEFRQRYSDESVTKKDVFHYIYALLHHPGYRERYADNLRRELPRIPFAPDFKAFAKAGRELARLHVEYRLGSRSALEWVIDQYQIKGESDPNREDDPGYIVRLIGQVVQVSVETTRIIKTLPDYK